MSKILLFLLIITLQLTSFAGRTSAADACTSSGVGISYRNPAYGTINDKTFFPENSPIILEFTINNNNTFKVLNGKKVRLHFPGFAWVGGEDTPSVDVTNQIFQITVPSTSDQAKAGDNHEGVLQWQPDPSKPGEWSDFCSQVKYAVGTGNTCKIFVLPAQVPPNSSASLSFLGLANRKYKLLVGTNRVAERQTSANGMGIFENILIPGTNGDKVTLAISTDDIGQFQSCMQTVTISSAAGPAPTIDPNAPLGIPTPGPSATPCTNPENCTVGGGETCDTGRGPSIKTAIGCVHTDPPELTKDVLTFLLGIGGGLAFLMMLLGAFQMMTSAGNPETLNAGRSRLTSAIIGLLFVIFAVLFMQIIGIGILNLPGFSNP